MDGDRGAGGRAALNSNRFTRVVSWRRLRILMRMPA